MKKISIILLMMMLCTSLSFGATLPADVSGNVYETAIKVLVEKNIVTGDVDGKFYPESRLTRAQACVMVVKAINPPAAEMNGTPTQVLDSGFSDMSGYGWAEGPIAYAVKKGIVNGYPDGNFKPGDLVKIEEITAMVLRASGYTGESLGGKYPSNYMEKANSLGVFNDIITTMIYPMQVTKGMTAKIIYNSLAMIEKANPQVPVGNGGDTTLPTLGGKTYLTGAFDATMTTFAGKTLASDVTVYAYGKKADYKSSMILSKDISDFRKDTVYKYKNVNTPIWYAMTGNKISEIILPMDVGFSGYAYGVINSMTTTLNADGDKVTGVDALVAGKPIRWIGMTSLTGIPNAGQYLSGMVYEFNLWDGQIKSMTTAGNLSRTAFVELSNWDQVYAFGDGVVRLHDASGKLFAVKNHAAVYVLSEDKTSYTPGSLSDIRKERSIKVYDMTDDKDDSADIVLVSKTVII